MSEANKSGGSGLESVADRVSDLINEAVSSNNFSNLSEQIGRLVGEVTNAAAGSAAEAIGSAADAVNEARETRRRLRSRSRAQYEESLRRQEEERRRKQYEAQFFSESENGGDGAPQTVCGVMGMIVFGLLTLWNAFLAAALAHFPLGAVNTPLAVFFGILTALSAVLAVAGRRKRAKSVRFRAYKNLLRPHLYANVKDLARAARVSEKTAVSDLEAMTADGSMKQGHFDRGKTCFIASDELYREYEAAASAQDENLRSRRAAEEQKRQDQEKYAPEVQKILEEGMEYIRRIRSANDAIEDPEISKKLDRMELIVGKIFDGVRENPSNARRLNMFMNYYLPTTAKLIGAYEEMDRQAVQGENIRKSKQEIADSLDTINDAFEKLLDSFFRAQAMDVTSDINVMKMMMSQEGLTPDEMSRMRASGQAPDSDKTGKPLSGSSGGAAAQMMAAGGTAAEGEKQ